MKDVPRAADGEPFAVEGYYDGVPYRFVDGTTIDALISGEVVRFTSFDDFVRPSVRPRSRYWGSCVIAAQIGVCFLSAFFVYAYYSYIPGLNLQHPGQLATVVKALPFACLGIVFLFARTSFGYFVCYYYFAVLLSYALVTPATSSWAMLAAAIAFFSPAMLLPGVQISAPEISIGALHKFLASILLLSAAVFVVASHYHFKIVSPADIYLHRNQIAFPKPLGYAIGITTGALLPFAFACYAFAGRWLAATLALALLLSSYPITLTKLNLLAPAWMLLLLLLSTRSGPRGTVMLSLLIPMTVGLLSILFVLVPGLPDDYLPIFGVLNFRLIAVPAISIELYDRFFAAHPLTHFCQVSLLKTLLSCPYSEQLGLVLEREFNFGTLNASLFATEGIASVGPLLAPFSAFACGLVIAMGNACSSRLPARFVIVSGGVAVSALLNVPMSTALLTHGLGTLFLLWLLTPRSFFDRPTSLKA